MALESKALGEGLVLSARISRILNGDIQEILFAFTIASSTEKLSVLSTVSQELRR